MSNDKDDIMLYFEANSLGAHHLLGKPQVVTIDRVEQGKAGHGAKAVRKPILHFTNIKLPFICNVTNARTIIALYGKRPSKWRGKTIEIYPTTTQFGSETKDCIRVKTYVPNGKAAVAASDDVESDSPPPEEGES